MLERDIVAAIKKYLASLGSDVFFWKEHGGAYSTAGIPDIICCYKGRFPYEAGDAGSGADCAERDEPNSGLTLPEYVYSTYNALLESGWRMKEIDEMDMLGFLRIRAWDARREKIKKTPKHAYIDEVWASVKPA